VFDDDQLRAVGDDGDAKLGMEITRSAGVKHGLLVTRSFPEMDTLSLGTLVVRAAARGGDDDDASRPPPRNRREPNWSYPVRSEEKSLLASTHCPP